jgi:hypothetical protein
MTSPFLGEPLIATPLSSMDPSSKAETQKNPDTDSEAGFKII